ncbi:unnamed protein product [Cylindrotheca closterium]|uniref:tRNA/rRNA methyltransferase SpoU type domain-containing protein n=1 Tax=Cylindrotheca closterium TaxID=2856 RepID=A0AAD2CJY2_9STRA|nr:unnamed protein product [Cylindrotheca closterium]
MASSTANTSNNDNTDEKDTSTHAQVTLLIENPKKNTNWGPLLRCCAAFDIAQIFVVGYDTCSVQGSHGASKHVELISFPTHGQAVETLKEHKFQLIGVLGGVANAYEGSGYMVHTMEQPIHHAEKAKTETVVAVSTDPSDSDQKEMPKSFPIHCRPFQQNTCLVVGKRAVGLPLRMAEHCEKFVHVPHVAALQPSINADGTTNNPKLTSWFTGEACVSMILHEFASWAGFHSETYQGQKYKVLKVIKGAPENQEAKRNERKRKAEELQQEEDDNAKNLFGGGDDEGDY